MNVHRYDTFDTLKQICPFSINTLSVSPHFERMQRIFDKRFTETVNYASAASPEVPIERIKERTHISLWAEIAVSLMLNGESGLDFFDTETTDYSYDIKDIDKELNIEIKVSTNKWPTMHTAGAKPYGSCPGEGLSLYSGLKGNTDVYFIFYYKDGIWIPNYFFAKRSLEKAPYEIAQTKVGGGAYVNRSGADKVYFFKNWCTL